MPIFETRCLVRFLSLSATLLALTASAAGVDGNAGATWDWNGIVGTGQSLAVGGRPLLTTNQPDGNLKLSTGQLSWPVDPNDTNLALVPLVEPVGRMAPRFPSSWPANIYGETPHTAMSIEISALVRSNLHRDYVTVHTEVGESGQGMRVIQKGAVVTNGVNGRAYEASLVATKAIARLAKVADKSYGVSAIVLIHGESDAGNTNYESEMFRLWQDYNTDLRAITGQTKDILMIVSQHHSFADRSPSTQAQWRIGVDHPESIVCPGPKYQYHSVEGVHLTSEGYRQLGEKIGQVYYERVVLGKDWQPLQPTAVEHQGTRITIHFHVPVPPLVWDAELAPPHSSVEEWKNGKGFEVTGAGGDRMTIVSAALSDDAVVLECASDPGPGARVGYAMVGEKNRMTTPFRGFYRWGLLRDSDPFVGTVTRVAQPNFAVAFELPVP